MLSEECVSVLGSPKSESNNLAQVGCLLSSCVAGLIFLSAYLPVDWAKHPFGFAASRST